ncbi:MAG: hypothetical protein HN576_00110, partial [Bacteriovoracaceae bacterium]|nr:hypothetical protein [Bacteriovoracaceae bacterium]
ITQDGTATGITWNLINSGDNKNYTLKAMTITGDGTLMPSISATIIKTVSLKDNNASTSFDNSVTYLTPATKVVFIIEPADSPANALMANITVQFQDAINNPVTSETSNITLTFGTDPTSGTATLGGSLTQPAVAGTATFNDINIDSAAVGFTFTATSGALTSDTSTSFNITIPSISSVTPPSDSTYSEGQIIDFIANVTSDVAVVGTPQIQLDIGGNIKFAIYQSALSSSTSLVFRYVIQALDFDTDGIGHSSPIQLNGGTILDSASNASILTFTPADTSGVIIQTATPGITVSEIDGVTAEDGTTATFTIVLDSPPSSNVAIGISSDDTTEGLPDVSILNFTNGNWNVPQLVTVTGQSDILIDGNIIYNIITEPATSADGTYNGINGSDVSVTNLDSGAAPGITVSGISNNTIENGTTATFTMSLDTMPSADVVVNLSSNDTTEGTVTPSSFTFTATNWSSSQTATVTGVDDLLEDSDQSYTILTAAATSFDTDYNGFDPSDVTLINFDDDSFGILVTAPSGNTAETGATSTFTIKLKSLPTANVNIAVSSNDTSEGIVDVSLLTFATSDWSIPQTITITGQDDSFQDGDQTYQIILGVSSSADANYNGIDPTDILIQNIDDDSIGITVSTISNDVNESGTTATATIFLTSQPTDDVIIGLSSDDTTEGTIDISSMTFTSSDWATPQTVTLTGADDAVQDGNQTFKIITSSVISTDSNYNGLNPDDVNVKNNDDDSPGIFLSMTSGLITNEIGSQDSFTIVLGSEPTDDVTIPISSSDSGEGIVSPSSLTFTPENWASPQIVTATGVDDSLQDGTQSYTIITGAATSTDATYDTYDALDCSSNNFDDDSVGFIVTPITATNQEYRIDTSEAGIFQTFTIVLTSQPAADVTIPVSSSDTGEGTLSPSLIVFTDQNWNVAQTITVTGVDDSAQDGHIEYTALTSAVISSDRNYDGLNPADIYLRNLDNDSPAITVDWNSTSNRIYIFESGGQHQVDYVLDSQPTDDVVINLSSNDLTEATVTPSSLTFTAENWNIEQTATVHSVDDTNRDGDKNVNLDGTVNSSDGNYNGITVERVKFKCIDDERTEILVSPDTDKNNRLTTTEGITSTTIEVYLTAAPTDDVTMDVDSDDTSEGVSSISTITFTPQNWNAPQEITITGVDDAIVDGIISYKLKLSNVSSNDNNYDGEKSPDTFLNNLDND